MPDDAIERAQFEQCAKELAYAFAPDTHGDHINVWWSSIEAARKAKYVASFEAAVRPLLAFASQQAPAGWRLVPIVPTREMKVAGGLAFNPDTDVTVVTSFEAGQAYTAMLDAAPSVILGEVG